MKNFKANKTMLKNLKTIFNCFKMDSLNPSISALIFTVGGAEYVFDMTCGVCPEQYDVYCNDKQVGYIRLRHSILTCECPDACDTLVYVHKFNTPNKGCFKNGWERFRYLRKCVKLINKYKTNNEIYGDRNNI